MSDIVDKINNTVNDKTLHQYDRDHMIQMLVMEDNEEANRKFLISILTGNSYYLHCDTCFERNGSRWGGAAMTSWNCAKCNGGQVSGSTAHATLCVGCALTTKKCLHCNYNDNNLKEFISGKA